MANNVRRQKKAFAALQKKLLGAQASSDFTRNRTAGGAEAILAGSDVDLFGSLHKRARRIGRALTIAEAGAGEGDFSKWLGMDLFGVKVTSVDPLPAKTNDRNIAGTFEALPLADGSQDVVLSAVTHLHARQAQGFRATR